jgi:hypothetical protein
MVADILGVTEAPTERDEAPSYKVNRADGRTVDVRLLNTMRGLDMRGGWLVGMVAGEAEFLKYDISDDALDALSPRFTEGGAFVGESVPGDQGSWFSLTVWQNQWEPSDALVAVGRTLQMRGRDPRLVQMRERDMARNGRIARRLWDVIPSRSIKDPFVLLPPSDVVGKTEGA